MIDDDDDDEVVYLGYIIYRLIKGPTTDLT